MTQRTLPQHLALAALLLAGAGACSTSQAKTQEAQPKPRVRVDAVDVVERTLPRSVVLTGTLVADRESEVMADTSGKVIQTFGELGDAVQAGAPLARLDARAARLSSSEAQAQSALLEVQQQNSERDCRRAESLFANGALSRSAYEGMTTSCAGAGHSLRAARARQGLADKAVSDSLLRAPFTGFIAERSVELGEYVTPGRKVATIVDSRVLRLELSVPESASSAVALGSSVEFTVAAHPQAHFTAAVQRLSPIVRRASRDQSVEAVIDNHDGRLRPGMFANARLTVGEWKLPVVPESALTGAAAARRVFVIQGQELQERLVQVGDVRDGVAPILKGLSAGERVVASPSGEIADGARIQ